MYRCQPFMGIMPLVFFGNSLELEWKIVKSVEKRINFQRQKQEIGQGGIRPEKSKPEIGHGLILFLKMEKLHFMILMMNSIFLQYEVVPG